MKEKRISLRFREDNERDMKAWNLLEEIALKKNASKNSVALELLIAGVEGNNRVNDDAFAELVASRVIERLNLSLPVNPASNEAKGAACREAPGADEPVELDEDALDFLDAFV